MDHNVSYTFRKSAFDTPHVWEITADGLLCTDCKGKRQTLIRYHFIERIRLQFQPYRHFRHRNFCCRITTTDRKTIDILSTRYVGFADFTDEAATYVPFVRALVKKTKSVNPKCIVYLGQSSAVYHGNKALLIIAIVFALLFIFYFPVEQKGLLSLMLLLIGAWQYLQMSKTVHAPQMLVEDDVPDYVLPRYCKDTDPPSDNRNIL